MTPAALNALIVAGDASAVIDALLALDDTARAELWKAAAASLRETRSDLWSAAEAGKRPPERRREQLHAACGAVLCCGNREQLRAFSSETQRASDLAARVMLARRPGWLQGWLDDLVPIWWPMLEPFLRADLVVVTPPMIASLPGMAHSYTDPSPKHHPGDAPAFVSAAELLRAYPALLASIWYLFEVDVRGPNGVAAVDNYSHGSWSRSLCELAAGGELDRSRLLDSSLDALARGFGQFHSGWFLRFHEALCPTLLERSERSERYLLLLGVPQGPTQSFALKAVSQLYSAQAVDGQRVVESLPPVFSGRAKGTARKALALLDRIVQTSPQLTRIALQAACVALDHDDVQVQSAAIALLARHSDVALQLRVEIDARALSIAASQRGAFEQLTGSVTASEDDRDPVDGSDVDARVARLPADLAAQAGLDTPLATFDRIDIPCLDPTAAITPVATVSELIACASRALEHPDEVDELERVIDALARLCATDLQELPRLSGPLRARAWTLFRRGVEQDPVEPTWSLSVALLSWIDGAAPVALDHRFDLSDDWSSRRDAGKAEPRSVLRFMLSRVWRVAAHALARDERILLSAPTHGGGWIDARVLVQRATQVTDPDLDDAVLALLRLAPDGREQALAQAGELHGELGGAIRHAIGGVDQPVGPTHALWIAAARARDPRGDDHAVLRRHPAHWPDAGSAARTSLESSKRPRGTGCEHRYLCIQVVVDGFIDPAAIDDEMPTVCARCRTSEWWPPARGGSSARTVATLRWCATMWPLNLDAFFEEGLERLHYNLDWWSACWQHRAYLEPLLDADVPFTRAAAVLVTLALSAKDATEQALAVDALVEAIADGRCDGATIGGEIAWLLPEHLRARRLAGTLERTAAISPLHRYEVAAAIERAIRFDPVQPPRDIHALLALLLECRVTDRLAIQDDHAVGTLQRMRKTATTNPIVVRLLALESDPHQKRVAAQRAQLLATSGRLQRAERWDRWRSTTLA